MFNLNLTFVKIIIFLLWLTMTISADDEETMDTTDEATSAPEPISAAKCLKKKTECCGQLFLGIEEDVMKCLTLHQSKLPPQTEKADPAKLFKFISCFIECQFKQRKYLGKGDNVNMKMVKSDAEKLFPNRPKEKEYHIKMFDTCSKDATTKYNIIKVSPAGKVLLKDACKPYFSFVYLCNAEYHKKQTCPYFRWQGKKNTDAEHECADEKQKCYEIEGISV